MIARTHKVRVKKIHVLTHTPCSPHSDPDDIGFFSVLKQRRQGGSFFAVVVVCFFSHKGPVQSRGFRADGIVEIVETVPSERRVRLGDVKFSGR